MQYHGDRHPVACAEVGAHHATERTTFRPTPASARRAGWLPRWMSSMRGDVDRLRAPRDARHERSGARFAVVLQSDDLPLSTWVVAPTSTGRRAASFRPEIEVNGQTARVMVEHLVTGDPATRLGEHAGRLEPDEIGAVDDALRTVLSLG